MNRSISNNIIVFSGPFPQTHPDLLMAMLRATG